MRNHRILYLGLEVPEHFKCHDVIHYPVIKIVPRKYNSRDIVGTFSQISNFTHFIFTSKSSVKIFSEYLPHFGLNVDILRNKIVIAVGRKTADSLSQIGVTSSVVAQEETAEGIVDELSKMDLENCFVFWPHSAQSRNVISDYLKERKVRFCESVLYDTVPHSPQPYPELNDVDEIVFTSPSTVDAFLNIYGLLPFHKQLTAIGPVTEARLLNAGMHHH